MAYCTEYFKREQNTVTPSIRWYSLSHNISKVKVCLGNLKLSLPRMKER
jgi:hypothetical protein